MKNKTIQKIISVLILIVLIMSSFPINVIATNEDAISVEEYGRLLNGGVITYEGDPTDVNNYNSWKDIDVNRYGKKVSVKIPIDVIKNNLSDYGLPANANDTQISGKQWDLYKAAVQQEMNVLCQMLINVNEKEIDNFSEDEMNNFIKALENCLNNPCFNVEYDTRYENKNKIQILHDELVNKHNDQLTKENKDDLNNVQDKADNIENNAGEYHYFAEDSADIGGILMKPVFALVNFVADSALQILTNVMMGDHKPVYGNTYVEYRPSTSSFLTIDATKGDRVDEWLFYTPEQIFSGSIDLLSIDFISGNNNNNDDWGAIRGTIATWYKILRLIAIIGLLSVLIYTGIKVIISSNTQNKAKYKEWIVNWFIAVAILFSMHYIMSFIIAGTNEISKLIQSSNQPIKIIYDSGSMITNFVGVVRFMVQSDDWYLKIGYEMMYILLVVYTFKFTFIYLKRVLSMAFLTLIAPIVALTYPIDKMNDGTAQGFNMWLKEYTFNALLQPLHQIMYYILVGSAVSIALDNPIYGVVVLMFMTEAEKLLKTIFGFDKARGGTVGGMAGAFTVGALASGVKDIARMAKLPQGGGKNGPSGNGGQGDINMPKPTKNDIDPDDFEKDDSKQISNKEAQRRMLDADDENSELDPETRDNYARDVEEPESMYSSTDDFMEQQRQQLIDAGYSEEQADKEMSEQFGDDYNRQQTQSQPDQTEPDQTEPDQNQPDPDQPKEIKSIRDLANAVKENKYVKKVGNGVKSVGKKTLKPIWDIEKPVKYNGLRLARKVGRVAAGVTVGTVAAATQAAISMADGKYSPFEAIGTFTAGYAGGGQISKSVEGLGSAFMEGTRSGDKQAQMKHAIEDWRNRDDVNSFYKREYGAQAKARMDRAASNYIERGFSDVKEQKQGMKYADKLVANNAEYNDENTTEERKKEILERADRQAMMALKFKSELKDQQSYGAMFDEDKQRKYIESHKHKVPANATQQQREQIEAENRKTEAELKVKFRTLAELNEAQK